MKSLRPTLCLLLLLSVLGCRTAPAPAPIAPPSIGRLVSPWDTRQVAPQDMAYNCGPALDIAPGIAVVDSKYKPTGDIPLAQDSVYAATSKAVADLAARVTTAADEYQSAGNLNAARCAANLLSYAANGHAMAGWMYNRDAVFEQTKGLRAVTIAYLKVRDSGALQPADQDLVLAWFRDIAHAQMNHFDQAHGCRPGRCDIDNHRAASAADAVAAVGVAADDHGMFLWGVRKARGIISTIDPDGFVAADLVYRWSLQFHLETAAALTQIAELAELNNTPLYGYDNGAIHLLIHRATGALEDPGPFVLRSHARQQMPKTLEGWEIGWATIYERRFPDPVIAQLLGQASNAGLYSWGGEPFGAEQEN